MMQTLLGNPLRVLMRFAALSLVWGGLQVGSGSPAVAQSWGEADAGTTQTRIGRPPSRALAGGQINPAASPLSVFRPAEIPPDIPPAEAQTVAPISYEVLEPREFSTYDPRYLPADPCYHDCAQSVPLLPNMFGDFFGIGTEPLIIQGDELLTASRGEIFDPADLGGGEENSFLLLSPGSSVVGRQKAADNNSPLPRDRVYLNYNYVTGTALQTGGLDLHRLTPGVERTFWDGNASVELRLPFGVTMDSDSLLGGRSSREAELGNVNLGAKGLLWASREVLLSMGLGLTVPTADDLRFFNTRGRELIRVDNQSVHLLPYLAGIWTDGGFFMQGFLQADFDLNGNRVSIDDGSGLRRAGVFQDSTFLYLDVGLGYWLIKDRYDSLINAIAPTAELHYNTALETTDRITSPAGIQFGGRLDQVEMVNAVFGVTLQLNQTNTLSIGYATPLGGGDDEQFDGELRVLFNTFFGGPSQRHGLRP